MGKRTFIFLTTEGYTYQPSSGSGTPDVENVQMLDISSGASQSTAFCRFVEDNPWVLRTSFDEVYCYELARRN